MNPTSKTIKDIRALHEQKGRKSAGLFIAEGTRTVSTFIKAGWHPVHLFASAGHEEFVLGLDPSIPSTLVSEITMTRMSASSTPSGVLALFKIPANPSAKNLSSGIVLAGIADPGNMGTLIRSCAAFGYSSVVTIESCDPFSPKVIQSTTGALTQVNLFRWNWQTLIEQKKDISLCALVQQGGVSPDQLSRKKPTLFVIGNEAHGIKQSWLNDCTTTATLTMQEQVESLNAAVAGSIALYLYSMQITTNYK